MRRPWILLFIFLLVLLFALSIHRACMDSLQRSEYVTGWALAMLVAALALYNVRKKLPAPPLGTSQGWLKFHVWGGFFTLVLFSLHIKFRMPHGWFESMLAALYLGVALSGVLGFVLSRTLARRLTTGGEEVIWEQIPVLRRGVREKIQTLALNSIPQTEATTLAEFYALRLHGFVQKPKNFWFHLIESRRPLKTLLDEIKELTRYAKDKEKEILKEISELIRFKDRLDYQYTLQAVLKGWLFVHIPLTYALLLSVLLHVVLVHAFSGGA